MNFTYITLLCDDSYLLGIKLLSKSLKKVKSQFPLLVLITNNVNQETIKQIEQLQINYKIINNIETPSNIIKFNLYNGYKNIYHYSHIFSKIEIFHELNFDKIIYLDADILILKNIDHLFYQQDDISVTIDISSIKTYQQKIFNSGFIIFSPKQDLFYKLLYYLNNYNLNNTIYKYIGDQALLNDFFANNYPININYLDNSKYNIQIPFVNTDLLKLNEKDIFFIHFIGPKKPWQIKNFINDKNKYFYEKAFNILNDLLGD